MNNVCRICLQSGNLIDLKCHCKNELSQVHYKCGKQWFSKFINVQLNGKLFDINWNVKLSCKCEICHGNICNKMCIKIFNDSQQE